MKRRYKKVKRERCIRTGKVIFTESEARRFVKNSLSSDEAKRKETRYYFCASCEGYHMTKMSKALYVSKASEDQLQKEEERKKANLFHRKKWEQLIERSKKNAANFAHDIYYSGNFRDDYGVLFCPKAVANLKELIDKTGAKIVISSTWRMQGLLAMQSMWKDRGLPGEVIDVTPSFYAKSCSVPRGVEIHDWLIKKGYWEFKDIIGEKQDQTEIKSYVILDDDTDMVWNQKNNFVHLDPLPGFADRRKLRRAINILNKETKKR